MFGCFIRYVSMRLLKTNEQANTNTSMNSNVASSFRFKYRLKFIEITVSH